MFLEYKKVVCLKIEFRQVVKVEVGRFNLNDYICIYSFICFFIYEDDVVGNVVFVVGIVIEWFGGLYYYMCDVVYIDCFVFFVVVESVDIQFVLNFFDNIVYFFGGMKNSVFFLGLQWVVSELVYYDFQVLFYFRLIVFLYNYVVLV